MPSWPSRDSPGQSLRIRIVGMSYVRFSSQERGSTITLPYMITSNG